MNLESIYKGKKIFLTGHTGFKGSWLLSWLHYLGANIKGYALAPENDNDLYNIINGQNLCESIIDDIQDKKKLVDEIVKFQPDFIFHLAAQPLVRLSYTQTVETFSVNAIGSANLLEGVRELEKPCVVVMITTDKVYHNIEKDYYYTESDMLGGYDPYSASKACAELIVDSYRNSFFHPEKYELHKKSISVARAGNVIGGGDWAKDRIIPDIIRALQNNDSVKVRNPNSVRPWQHVLEPLNGYLMLAANQKKDPVHFAQAYNFGPLKNDLLKVNELVSIAIKSWGQGSLEHIQSNDQYHEAGLLQLDITKAMTQLSWKPKMDSHEAIEWSIKWYKNIFDKTVDAKNLVLNDIVNYESKFE